MKSSILLMILVFLGIVFQNPILMVVSAWLLIFTLMEMAVKQIKKGV